MTGVLFEGGSFRPVFSCGIMDALLEEGIMFPYCIGVSAGQQMQRHIYQGSRSEISEYLKNIEMINAI